jgi:hypothetical protein
MALTPTVSIAGQAFPAVTSPQSFVEIPTPAPISVASQPLDRPSNVLSSLFSEIPSVNVSQQSFFALNRPEYIVLPNRKTNLPTNDPISPIVLQVTSWPAPNRIVVSQVTGGIVLPPVAIGVPPSGFVPSTNAIDLASFGVSFLGRQILMVDKPLYLTPEPYFQIPAGRTPVNSSGTLVTPSPAISADSFAEVNNAVVIGISGTNTLILSKSFDSDPTGAWLILDQRIGSEAQANDFSFQGSFTPDPFLPFPFPINAPFNGDLGTFRPQFSAPPDFSPNAPQALPPFSPAISPTTIAQPFIPNDPQALPPITQTVNPSNQAFDGLPNSFFQ